MKHKFEILVVDDDLKNIQVGINFLKQNEDYHLVFATNGQQALERVQETAFDLILLDIIMPVMDGYEVCRQLKADPKTRNIPVIFLTAKHEADSLMKGFELGGADYVTKPFNAPELNARVKTHLELHHYYKTEIAKLLDVLACCQKTETIKFIAGGICHDCNNFLASISPSVKLLESRLQKNGHSVEPYRDLLGGIDSAAAKVSDVLATLANFSLLCEESREPADMEQVVYDLDRLCKGALQQNISFTSDILTRPALAAASKLHIEQVLMNMLINAQHAILAKGDAAGRGHIHLTIDRVAGSAMAGLDDTLNYLCLRFEDNGIGMATEIMDRIFDQYFTTRKEAGGTGLGLAVSQSIINSYGGCIEVSSKENYGTTFKIYLPMFSG